MRAALAISIVSCPAPSRAETFEQVLEIVADKNPRLLSARYLTEAAGAEAAAARSALQPQLGVTADLGWADRRSVGASSGVAVLPEIRVSQLVYDGGRTPAEIRRRRLRVHLLGAQEFAALSDLSLQLAQAWTEYTRAAELAGVSEQQIAALELLSGLVGEIALYDRGRTSDTVMVQSRLEQARTALYSRQIALAQARDRIREVASQPVEPEGPVPDLAGAIPASMTDCLALVDDAPMARVAAQQVAESAEGVSATRNWWAPQLALEAARTSDRGPLGEARVLNGFAVRLRTSVLAFDSGGGRARHDAAKATLASARSNDDFVRQSLSDQVARLWSQQAQRTDRLPALVHVVERADEARDIVFEQFRIGRRSILDVLSYDVERFALRAQLVNERFDIVAARYQLMGALGLIIDAASNPAERPTVPAKGGRLDG